MKNIEKIIDFCDLVVFYDNTYAFNKFAMKQKDSKIIFLDTPPEWFRKNVMTLDFQNKYIGSDDMLEFAGINNLKTYITFDKPVV